MEPATPSTVRKQSIRFQSASLPRRAIQKYAIHESRYKEVRVCNIPSTLDTIQLRPIQYANDFSKPRHARYHDVAKM